MKWKDLSHPNTLREWFETDKHLQELRTAPFQWEWPGFSSLASRIEGSSRGGIHVLRGPRQVGKTTFLKSLIQRLHSNVPQFPRTALLQGDWIENFKELDAGLRPWLEETAQQRGFVLIDEVTSIKDWQRALKGWIDEGLGAHVHFLLTGSNWFDLRRHAELLPGRRGSGVDVELLPMGFSDFLKSVAPACRLEDQPAQAFELYLRLGGFPHAAREYLASSQTSEAENTYLAWIRGDTLKSGRNDSLLRELFSAVLQTAGTPVGLDDLRSKSSFGSHMTVKEYVELTLDLFVLTQLQLITPGTWTLSARKNRKYYFRDPLVARIALSWSDAPIDPTRLRAYLCEMVVAEWIARQGEKTGYHRDRSQREIDFLSRRRAIEVKSGSPSSPGLISEWKNDGVTKILLHADPKWKAPAPSPSLRVLPIWEFLSRDT